MLNSSIEADSTSRFNMPARLRNSRNASRNTHSFIETVEGTSGVVRCLPVPEPAVIRIGASRTFYAK
jgi:hypothetical protein